MGTLFPFIKWSRMLLRLVRIMGLLIKEAIIYLFLHKFASTDFFSARYRKKLEKLGPTFVKLGQIMSTRWDVLPEQFRVELEK